MKLSLFGAVSISLAMGMASAAYADNRGYDPMALDHFVEANLAMVGSKGLLGKKKAITPSEKLALAGKGLRYDSKGYLIDASGNRVKGKMRIRWQVGVFR